VIDGVLHQVADALEAISVALPVTTLLLDGGMSRSDWIVRRLAEIAGLEVTRAAHGEATAMGAAMMAGLAAGIWSEVEEFGAVACDLTAEPSWSGDERAMRRARWVRAVELARAWIG
jgi:glycerol kinase